MLAWLYWNCNGLNDSVITLCMVTRPCEGFRHPDSSVRGGEHFVPRPCWYFTFLHAGIHFRSSDPIQYSQTTITLHESPQDKILSSPVENCARQNVPAPTRDFSIPWLQRCMLAWRRACNGNSVYIPFLGIARPQPKFPHSCVCERFIYCTYCIPRISLHISSSRKGRPIVGICNSLTWHMNVCAADFSLLNLPKGKSLGRSKPATNS
jgi:hypothetical protein